MEHRTLVMEHQAPDAPRALHCPPYAGGSLRRLRQAQCRQAQDQRPGVALFLHPVPIDVQNLSRVHHSSVCVPCVIAPPARSAAAISVVSASSCSVAPAFFAFFEWISMQYGHCVVSATATAINSLYLSGITPCLTTASSNATNALKASGASSPIRLSLERFFMSYMSRSP